MLLGWKHFGTIRLNSCEQLPSHSQLWWVPCRIQQTAGFRLDGDQCMWLDDRGWSSSSERKMETNTSSSEWTLNWTHIKPLYIDCPVKRACICCARWQACNNTKEWDHHIWLGISYIPHQRLFRFLWLIEYDLSMNGIPLKLCVNVTIDWLHQHQAFHHNS